MDCGMTGVSIDDSDDEYCVCIGMIVPGGCDVEICPGPSECPYTDKFREDEDENEDVEDD